GGFRRRCGWGVGRAIREDLPRQGQLLARTVRRQDLAGRCLAGILEGNSDAVILGVRSRAARPYPGGSESRNRLSGTPTWPVLLFGAPAIARAVWIGRPGTWTDQIGSPNVPAPRVRPRHGSDSARRRRVHQVPRIPGTTTVRNRAAAAPCERDAGAPGHPRRGRNRGLV